MGFMFAIPDLLQARRGVPIDTVILKTIAVDPAMSGMGLGGALMDLVQRARARPGLSTRDPRVDPRDERLGGRSAAAPRGRSGVTRSFRDSCEHRRAFSRSRPGAVGDRDAIVERRRRITFRELDRAAGSAAGDLARAGVRPGMRALVFSPMSIALYTTMIALFRLRATAVFVDPSAGRERLDRCVARVRPDAFVAVPRAHWLRLTSTGFAPFPSRAPSAAGCRAPRRSWRRVSDGPGERRALRSRHAGDHHLHERVDRRAQGRGPHARVPDRAAPCAGREPRARARGHRPVHAADLSVGEPRVRRDERHSRCRSQGAGRDRSGAGRRADLAPCGRPAPWPRRRSWRGWSITPFDMAGTSARFAGSTPEGRRSFRRCWMRLRRWRRTRRWSPSTVRRRPSRSRRSIGGTSAPTIAPR